MNADLKTCHGCGLTYDITIEEVYPYPEDETICEDPIPPILEINCSGQPWRRVNVCFDCFHKLQPDMWIDRRGWESINPTTPFAELPLLHYCTRIPEEAVA
jgi:hypothetical protein